MNSRERLMAALRGQPMDRPAVSFYEVGGFAVDPTDPDPYNVYNSPDWHPLLKLAEEQTDLIRMRRPRLRRSPHSRWNEFFSTEIWKDLHSRFTRTTLRVAGRTMTSLVRRDRDVDTNWTIEHLLKDEEDLKAFLDLPDEVFEPGEADAAALQAEDDLLGDRGIVMVDMSDPICRAAELFSMEAYTCIAYTEPALFHRLLEKMSLAVYPAVEEISRLFPGHLWRIVGPEYAAEPYLPVSLFEDYVVRYTKPMIDAIHQHGGFARVHCHGRIRNILPHIAAMGADAIDPLEPSPLGDVDLAFVRERYGRQMTLFGNLEIRDIETLAPEEFAPVVALSLREGTTGEGKGFVLMPSASPYGRNIAPHVLANYEVMIRMAKETITA